MKKIAFISHIRDGTGYANSALGFVECLDFIGYDVVNCWTSLSRNLRPVPENIVKLENKDLNNVDIVIQYTLPQYFSRKEGVRNIGLFCCETTHFRGSNWQYSCNIMDEIWVLTPECKQACLDSGVTVPIYEVTPPHNIEKYNKTYEPLFIPDSNNRFVFYNIGEISYRKNINGLIASYYNAFTSNDPVILVIKGFMDQRSNKDTERDAAQMIQQLKKEIKKNSAAAYPPVVVITDWLSQTQIMGLHTLGDCFVSLSRGEAENIPLFEAAAMGNSCIGPNWNGPKKILSNTHHSLVPCVEKPVFGMGNSPAGLYLYDEVWYEPSILQASQEMKSIHNAFIFQKPKFDKRNKDSTEKIQVRHSYDTAGQVLAKIIGP